MTRLAALLAALGLGGCVMGIPDAGPEIRPAKPCQKVVIVYPEKRAVCMTKDEFNRWMRRNLPGAEP